MSSRINIGQARANAARMGMGGSPTARQVGTPLPRTPGPKGGTPRRSQGEAPTAGGIAGSDMHISAAAPEVAAPTIGREQHHAAEPAAALPTTTTQHRHRHTPLSDTGGQPIGHSSPTNQHGKHPDLIQQDPATHTIHMDQSTPLTGDSSVSAPQQETTVVNSLDKKVDNMRFYHRG